MPTIPAESRYRLTPLIQDALIQPGVLRLGLWQVPPIDMRQYYLYKIGAGDRRLDLIAHKVLGDSRLWWAIAYPNHIKNPLDDLPVGQTLMIPTMEAITTALVGNATVG